MFEGHIAAALVGITTAVVGLITAVFAPLLAATGSEISPWAQVGGTATAVGALAYVAKLLADGKLVAQPVADLLRDAKAREDKIEKLIEDTKVHLNKVAEDSRAREDAFRSFLIHGSNAFDPRGDHHER